MDQVYEIEVSVSSSSLERRLKHSDVSADVAPDICFAVYGATIWMWLEFRMFAVC